MRAQLYLHYLFKVLSPKIVGHVLRYRELRVQLLNFKGTQIHLETEMNMLYVI